MSYSEFLEAKKSSVESVGFDVEKLPDCLFDYQAAMIEDKMGRVKMTLGKGGVAFERGGPGEEGIDQIDAEYDGDDFVAAFNARYVINALKSIKTGKTVVHFNDPATPVLFCAENDDHASWLIMPMRV